MNFLKKSSILFILLFISTITLYAGPAENVQEYTLENGMKVYLLEDTSDALVHIEFTTRAGFSSQTQSTCGFFKLFTRLIVQSTPSLTFSEVQCNSDSSRYQLNITPQQTETTLDLLSRTFFSPDFSDELLNSELSKLKSEVSDSADDLSTYINAAIDSRVFSDAPWKHDSGIYPPLFKKTTSKTARNILQDISDRWYIPKNSAIFIYGNINTERVLLILKQTCGRFYSNYQTPVEKPSVPINKQRKYVFHNPEISTELTQIVVQYTMMDMEECNILATTLNNDVSTFKQNALSIPELNIPGAEYIDVSSANKRDSSRLIIQTLLQPPENTSLGITSLEQTNEFLEQVFRIPENIDSVELQFAKKQIVQNLQSITASPTTLMQNLASYWAMDPYIQNYEIEQYLESSLIENMLYESSIIENTDNQDLKLKLQSETPFIFVIINSKDFYKNQKEYLNAGFEEINENNSSWYVQKMFEEIRNQFKPDESISISNRGNTNDNSFYKKNLSQISTKVLKNGIKIIAKQNLNSNNISMILSIKGGKLNSADDNGFEEVMVNLLAGMIEKQITKKQYEGLITGNPTVSSKTDISTSSILIEFEKEDETAVCEAITNAIIYGEIPPAAADKAVSSKQYRKRLENGSAINQLYSAAIKNLYNKTDFPKIFEAEKDVLEKTDYTAILSGYPALLDAARYTIIVTGNYDEQLFTSLEAGLSIFSANNQKLNIPENIPEISKSKNLNVKIRHTFLTDIPAEKAGPQPAVLVPTTEFLDPVIYITKSPEPGTKNSALFNAILNFLGDELQKTIDNNSKFKDSKVLIQLPQSRLNFGTVIIQNVNHTKEADSAYKSAIQNISNRLNNPNERNKTLQNIQDAWTLNQMIDSAGNSGTASLIQKGLELLPEDYCPEYYLNEYNYIQTATIQDFIEAMDLFPVKANLRVYSTEGKE